MSFGGMRRDRNATVWRWELVGVCDVLFLYLSYGLDVYTLRSTLSESVNPILSFHKSTTIFIRSGSVFMYTMTIRISMTVPSASSILRSTLEVLFLIIQAAIRKLGFY